MKKTILCVTAALSCAALYAATGDGASDGSVTVSLGSFTGITAAVSALVTQFFKAVPAVKENTLSKIGISALSGVSLCLAAWGLGISPALAEYGWWQSALYGLCAGLSGCGFYDVIKALWALAKK